MLFPAFPSYHVHRVSRRRIYLPLRLGNSRILTKTRVVEGVKAQGRVAKRPVNEGRGGGLGPGIWAGR